MQYDYNMHYANNAVISN